MQEESERPDTEHKNVPVGNDPVLLLIIASLVCVVLGDALVAGTVVGLLFTLVFGLWYFLAVLLFFKKTRGRWKWETVAFVIIGLICHYEIFWSQVTPEYLKSDAQAGLIFVFGPLWAGLAALVGDAGVALLSVLVRTIMRTEKKEK